MDLPNSNAQKSRIWLTMGGNRSTHNMVYKRRCVLVKTWTIVSNLPPPSPNGFLADGRIRISDFAVKFRVTFFENDPTQTETSSSKSGVDRE